MSKIYGSLTVPMGDWKYVYSTILNYFNQEIDVAYTEATNFYLENKNLNYNAFLTALNVYFSENEVTAFRKFLIETSMTKTNTKIYKPKKNHFQSFNNRTLTLATPEVKIEFNKKENTVSLETAVFEDFDKHLANNTFISEFINMVNSFNWPNRTGPNKAVRGCTLIKESPLGETVLFLSSGPNPPSYNVDANEVVNTPNHLNSDLIKNIKLTSDSTEETNQPSPEPQDLSEV